MIYARPPLDHDKKLTVKSRVIVPTFLASLHKSYFSSGSLSGNGHLPRLRPSRDVAWMAVDDCHLGAAFVN